MLGKTPDFDLYCVLVSLGQASPKNTKMAGLVAVARQKLGDEAEDAYFCLKNRWTISPDCGTRTSRESRWRYWKELSVSWQM